MSARRSACSRSERCVANKALCVVEVVYGTVDRTDYFGSEPLAQGYNLLQLHSDYGIQPVPMIKTIAPTM